MSPVRKTQLALRTKILLFTGSVITVIMLIASVAMLLGFRNLIIEGAIRNAKNITRAFEIPVLNEFLKHETENFSLQEALGSLVSNYKAKSDNIKYIEIIDNSGKILAHTDWSKVNGNDTLGFNLPVGQNIYYSIFSSQYGKVLETVIPVSIAGKKWALMKIGFGTEAISGELRKYFYIFFFSTFLAILAALWVLYLISGKLTATLADLVEILDNFDYELELTREKVKITDETEFIYEKFEKMRKRLLSSKEELLLAQKQLFQAEKLASIGRLASGVAHEINNPLNGIKSCLYSINKHPNDYERNKEYLELIDEGITNIELIVKKLLGFARQKSKSDENVDICENLDKVISLLDYKLKQKEIELLKLCEDAPVINADSQLLQEVFMNLIINAFDAVEKGGTIKISVKEFSDQVRILFEDNGSGIAETDLKKIFDPFYTTKEPGKGTGLGLSVSLGIIENLNGSIEVESLIGKGTKFTVTIPKKGNLK